MAQTKRKRRTKHRGTPVGTIESRGRTGRKPTSAESKGAKPGSKEAARERRLARIDQPPTWRSAANRALIAAVVLFAFLVLAFRRSVGEALALTGFAFVVYVPMGYYTDLLIYRRRQSRKLRKKAADKK
jgi:hypothetical protein